MYHSLQNTYLLYLQTQTIGIRRQMMLQLQVNISPDYQDYALSAMHR